MVNSLLGYAVGNGESIIKTTDGGALWTAQTGTGAGSDLWRVRFVNAISGMAVGAGGLIIKTGNGGTTWTQSRAPGGYDLRGLDYADLNTIVAVGGNGTILRSPDGGATWDSIPSPTTAFLYGVDFVSQNVGFIVGNMGIMKTVNGGLSWNILSLPDYTSFYDIAFKDANNGIVVGVQGYILRTTDGGATWKKQITGTETYLNAAAYRGRSLAAAGDNGLVLSALDPQTESEPNDSPGSAQLVAYRDDVDAKIDPGDTDYYKFVASGADTIAILVQSRDSAVVNGVLNLLDVDGATVLDSSDNFVPGDTVRSRIAYVLPGAGTYYFRYAGVSAASSGDYKISLSQTTLRPIIPFGGVATIVSTSESILKSPVVPNNLPTTISFEYGTTIAYGSSAAADQVNPGGQELVNATATLNGLTPFTEYHFRVKATNAAGTAYGPDVSFLTALGTLKSETEGNNTVAAANTIFVGDTVQATISSNTDVDYYRFQAAAGDSLEIFVQERNASGLEARLQVIDSTGNTNIFVDNNYLPDVKSIHAAFVAINTGVYHVRVTYAYNYSTYYPSQAPPSPRPTLSGVPTAPTSTSATSGDYELRLKRFEPAAPDVRKSPWADITFSTSAQIHVDVTSGGLPTDVFVEYGTTTSLGSSVQYAGGPINTIEYQYWFRIPVSGLTAGTLYYFRLKAVNALGTSYSDISTFTTSAASDRWTVLQTNTDASLVDVATSSDSIAVVLGQNRSMLRTTDAGATWSETTLPRYPNTVAFKDADTAFAASYSLIRSVDKGATWQFYQDFPSDTYAERVRFYDGQVGAAVGERYSQSLGNYIGQITRTLDGGATWQLIKFVDNQVADVSFVSADTVRMVSYNGWFYHTDNFTAPTPSWDSLQVGTGLRGLHFVDGNIGIAVGAYSIMRTTDGGANWSQVASPGAYMNGIAMKNSQIGIAVGGGGLIFRTTNAGATWTQEQSGTSTWLVGASYAGRFALAAGEVGTILRSVDPLGEQEPNNTSGAANAFAIGEQIEGLIDSPGDVDFYSFAVSGTDTLKALLTGSGGNPVNGALELIDTDGSSTIVQNDDFLQGDTTISRIVYIIGTPGTYYLKVSGSSPSSVGGYILTLERTDLRPVIVSSGVASLKPDSADISGVVDPKTLSTTVQVQYGLTPSYGTVVSANESPLAPGQQEIAVTATLPGLTEDTDYHFRMIAVNTPGDTVLGNDILFHTPKATAIVETEPNDSASSSMVLELAFGDSVNGRIDTVSDVDYYRMHIAAGDTVDVYVSRRGSSQLEGKIAIIDSSTGSYWDNINWFPSNQNLHSIVENYQAATIYLRYSYSYNYGSFPGTRNDGELPVPPSVGSSIMQTATPDTGEYRLFVRRFQPGAPEGQDYVGYGSIFSDAAQLQTTVLANGLPTMVNFEYGTTTAYGNQVTSVEPPFTGISRLGATSPLITGLQPSTTYYVRSVLTNSAGSTFGGGNTITTPPAPDGWSREQSGTMAGLWDIAFPAQQTGYAVGNDGVILKTTDGGSTWTPQTSGTFNQLRGVSFVSDQIGTVAGYNSTISRTTNGGTTWISQMTGGGFSLFDVKMLNASEIVAVGSQGTILRSTNSGASWDTVHAGTEVFRSLTFAAGSDTGYTSGYDQSTGNGVLFQSVNRGQTWQPLTPPSTSSLLSVWFFDGHTGIVGGGSRMFYRTTDAGATWSSFSSQGNGYYAYGIWFADSQNGIATGDNGMILRSFDGGGSWIPQESGTYNYLFGAAIIGRSLFTVGSYGTILNTQGLLAPPTGFMASYTSTDSVVLSWTDNTSSETGYKVERKTGQGGTYAEVNTLAPFGGGAASYVDHPLRGQIYYYRVSAFSASDTVYSSEDSVSVPFAAPTALNASSGGSSTINLSWQTMTDAKDGFKIERATSAAGTFTQIAAPAAGATSYADNGVVSGSQYFYRIRSYNTVMQSSYSNIDSARTALGKPQNTTANPAGVTNGPITISWTAPNGADSVWFAVDSPPPAAGPPATQAAVSNNSFVIVNPPPGLRWLYYALVDPDGNVDLNAYDSVQIAFDNVAPQITDQTTLPTVTITGSAVSDPASVTISASIVKTGGIAGLNAGVVEYKKTNSNTISQSTFPGTGGGSVTLSNLNSLFLTIGKPNGVEYRIKATDQAGNVASTVWKSFTVFVSNPPVSDFVTPAAGTSDDATTLVASYRLFSVPYDLQDKKPASFMESTDNGLGLHQKDGVNYYYWRMQRYVNGSYQDYEDFKGQDVLTPGAAFFLISREQKFVTVGAGNLVKAQDMFNNGIQVTQGWNLIGNPFPDNFPADSLFVLAGSITDTAYYDGTGPDGGWWKTGANVHTLKKWEGLAINVTQSTSLRFKAVPQPRKDTTTIVPAASIMQTLSKNESKGWLFQFDATRSGSAIRDVDNLVGVAPDAKAGYDHYDSYQPPILPGRSLALYFKNADGAMSNDIRPPAGDGETWEMKVVTGDRGARVTLNVKHVVEIPDLSSKAFLLDLDDRMAYDLRQRSEIEFGSKEGLRNMRLTVGTKQYVDSVSASYGIDLVPKSFRVFQNYPNPFNPSTVIRFAVPGVQPSYKVTLKIYNILGQEVKVLLNDNIQPGYYEKTWNAVGYASGTYFMRLTIDGGTGNSRFSDVKKMVLIK